MSLTAEFIAEKRWVHDREQQAVAERPACTQWRERLTDLLARAGQGDRSAFMEFYDHTSAVAYRAALTRYADPVAAQAATQALFVRAWERARTHATSGLSPLAWLLTVPATPTLRAC